MLTRGSASVNVKAVCVPPFPIAEHRLPQLHMLISGQCGTAPSGEPESAVFAPRWSWTPWPLPEKVLLGGP